MSAQIVAVVLASLAVLAAAITLYFSFLRPARITVISGECVDLLYTPEGCLRFILPVGCYNSGARVATIVRWGLLISTPSSSRDYLLQAVQYSRLNAQGDFEADSHPVPISLSRLDKVPKVITFSSSTPPGDLPPLRPGPHNMQLLAWIDESKNPMVADEFTLDVEEDVARFLTERRDRNEPLSIRVKPKKWPDWPGGGYLDERAADALKKAQRRRRWRRVLW